jgi:protein phosphatase
MGLLHRDNAIPRAPAPPLPNGRVATYHDNSCHGEDAYVIREFDAQHALDAVLDGTTGSGGKVASQHVVELLQSAPVGSIDDVIILLETANQELFRRGRGSFFLTTVSLALKRGDVLDLVSVGDSPIWLMRDGAIVSLTTATMGSLSVGITQVLGQHERLRYKTRQLTLQERDWLIIASDGLTQNVAPAELAALLKSVTSPDDAVSAVGSLLREKRRTNKGRIDEHSSFLVDDVTAVFRYLAPVAEPR